MNVIKLATQGTDEDIRRDILTTINNFIVVKANQKNFERSQEDLVTGQLITSVPKPKRKRTAPKPKDTGSDAAPMAVDASSTTTPSSAEVDLTNSSV